ncbi:MAG: MaoC/PaaZ C-terminal domain-containing protein [Promethearchaeota archaeon]
MSDDKLNLSMIKIGQKIPPLKVKVEKKTYKQYNKLIKEINPMHLNKIYVQRLGYNDVLIAGNFLFSFIPKWIIYWIDSNIKALNNITVKFENPVYPDDEIVFKGKITDIKTDNNKKIVNCEYHAEKLNGNRVMNGNFALSISI